MTAGARRPGSGRDHSGRRAGTGRDRRARPRCMTPGPAQRPAADDFPSEPLRAADFPSGEFSGRSLPTSLPVNSLGLTARRGRSHGQVSHRAGPRTDEFASGPLPEADFASSEFPAADFRPRKCPPPVPAPGLRRRRPTPAGTAPTHAAGRAGQNAPKGALAQARRR